VDIAPHIERARRKRRDLEAALAAFDFSRNSQDEYRRLSREYQTATRLIESWDRLCEVEREIAEHREMLAAEEDDPEFLDLLRAELEDAEKRREQLEKEILQSLLPPDPYEDRNLIIEIRPAAGGEEAGLFAADLLRMYTRFADRQDWRLQLLDVNSTELGGVKQAVFSLKGDNVFRYMQYESGVHRVQRIPVTESGGRIHTSTVTVAVLPEAEEVEIEIRPQDLRIDVFRSSGPGGQSVNTTDSAVRITHVPTGLVVTCRQEKSQHQNREIAMRILRSRLLARKRAEEEARSADARRRQVGTGDRSERIRTYNYPQNRVTDHRFGVTRYDLPEILDGALDLLLDEVIAVDATRRLSELADAG